LAKSEPVREFSIDLPHDLKEHFDTALSPEAAGVMLKELLGLAQRQPHTACGREIIPVSSQFYWIGRLVPTVLGKLFEKAALIQPEIETAAEALHLLGLIRECHRHDYHRPEETEMLNELSKKEPRVRQHYFWRIAVAYRVARRQEATRALDLY
jgi:hypothetical protein